MSPLTTSGDWYCDMKTILTCEVFNFMGDRYKQLKDAIVEVNQVDLTNEYGVLKIIIIISLAYIIANIISIFNINFNFSKHFS